MAAPTVKLNNGHLLPVLGLGTYQSYKGDVVQAVKDAIDAGYRHIDCAWFYENENEVGQAIKEKIEEGVVKREDLFITSKLWNNFHAKEDVVPMLKTTLKSLGLDYLDLYLIHWPVSFKKDVGKWPIDLGKEAFADVPHTETWAEMERCVELGLTKSIGLSNFNSEQIENILKHCKIKPVTNQVECNPNVNQKKLTKFCKDRDIVITAYCPMGQPSSKGIKPGFPEPTIFDPKVIEIGKKYGKTAGQVVLNYLVKNLGVVPIPKSVTKSRIIENISIFDFELTPEEVKYMDSLNCDVRICPFSEYKDHKDYCFNIEF